MVENDFPKLAEIVGRLPTIRDNPPLIYHWRENEHKKFFAGAKTAFDRYRETMAEDRRLSWIITKSATSPSRWWASAVWDLVRHPAALGQRNDPLFLQVKEAGPSVWRPYAGKSIYPNHGQRVVNGSVDAIGQRSVSGLDGGRYGRQFYVRQLKDMKIKMLVEIFIRSVMVQYAELCGWTLARAHARSGEPAKIAGYLGNSDKFDEAVADFSIAYADQSERDHKVLMKAVKDGDTGSDHRT